jgi:hypothetical protein
MLVFTCEPARYLQLARVNDAFHFMIYIAENLAHRNVKKTWRPLAPIHLANAALLFLSVLLTLLRWHQSVSPDP